MAAVTVSADLMFSLSKPLWAKGSDLYGRGEIYPFPLVAMSLGLILTATASGFGQYAAGYVFAFCGRSGVNTLNSLVIADLTSTRQRGFGINFQFFPYLIMPVSSTFLSVQVHLTKEKLRPTKIFTDKSTVGICLCD